MKDDTNWRTWKNSVMAGKQKALGSQGRGDYCIELFLCSERERGMINIWVSGD